MKKKTKVQEYLAQRVLNAANIGKLLLFVNVNNICYVKAGH